MITKFPNSVLPGPVYAILGIRGENLGYVTAETAHEALGEATKEIGAKARAAIIKTQLDKEQEYARSTSSTAPTGTTSTSPGTYSGTSPGPSSNASPRARTFANTRGAWKPGTGKRGR